MFPPEYLFKFWCNRESSVDVPPTSIFFFFNVEFVLYIYTYGADEVVLFILEYRYTYKTLLERHNSTDAHSAILISSF